MYENYPAHRPALDIGRAPHPRNVVRRVASLVLIAILAIAILLHIVTPAAAITHRLLRILHASEIGVGNWFGYTVAASGSTIVVGAPYANGGAGAAYVFENGSQARILRASDAQNGDGFGRSVSISGDTIVVGAPFEAGGSGNPAASAGAGYVFERNQGGAGNWGQVAILHASDLQTGDRFGVSAGISGDTIVIGAESEDGGSGDPTGDSGAGYVFERDQGGTGSWGQVTVLRSSDSQAGDSFGNSVAVDGDTAIVGAPHEDGGSGDPVSASGAAYVFERDQGGAGSWGQAAALRASDAQTNDYFGTSVAISGDVAVVGAEYEDGGSGDPTSASGAAYIFGRDQGGTGSWGEITPLRASDPLTHDHFGCSVAVSGNVIAVGAYQADGGLGDPVNGAGAGYAFERNAGGADNWGEVAILAGSDAQTGDEFGYSVALHGVTMVFGARSEDGGPGNPASATGAAYLFAIGEPFYLPMVMRG